MRTVQIITKSCHFRYSSVESMNVGFGAQELLILHPNSDIY